MGRDLAVLAAAVVLALAAIAAPQAAENNDKLNVVASFSILHDVVARVGGDHIEVSTLVGPGADPPCLCADPAGRQDCRYGEADRRQRPMIRGMDGSPAAGIRDARCRHRGERRRRAAAPTLPSPTRGGGPGGEPLRERLRPASTPHAWQRIDDAEIYVANIRDGLIRADPQGRATYEANAAAYSEELARLDADVRRAVAMVPPARRKVITTHDAFGYFAADYGVAFIAAQGVSTEVQPSAKDIAGIIRTIRQQNIPALFFENAVDPRLVRRIAAETGARIGGTLFSDTLAGPAGPAPTYLDMMRHNVREIVEALK
jgi:zinc/manganese transport system substrate-binding protein